MIGREVEEVISYGGAAVARVVEPREFFLEKSVAFDDGGVRWMDKGGED